MTDRGQSKKYNHIPDAFHQLRCTLRYGSVTRWISISSKLHTCKADEDQPQPSQILHLHVLEIPPIWDYSMRKELSVKYTRKPHQKQTEQSNLQILTWSRFEGSCECSMCTRFEQEINLYQEYLKQRLIMRQEIRARGKHTPLHPSNEQPPQSFSFVVSYKRRWYQTFEAETGGDLLKSLYRCF